MKKLFILLFVIFLLLISTKTAKALNFDGSNDYVNLGDVLNLSLPATISMWIKPNTLSSSSANQGLISTDKDNNSFHSGNFTINYA